MARAPIMAAGGIVLRREQPPRIAVVRLRKRDEWVLPKGKLDAGETPREAAKREVLEETGHSVTVHEFLGTLVYSNGVRSKVVHYWRMEASGAPSRELMDDVRAVDWLPLDAAVARLSRDHEKTFLENVGPYALAGLIRKAKDRPVAASKPAAAANSVTKPVAKSAAKAAVPAKAPASRKRRSPLAEPPPIPAELPDAIVAAASIGPVPPIVAEVTPAESVTAEDNLAAAIAAPAEAADQEPPAEVAPAARDDVDRVQAVATEIKSMISGAKSAPAADVDAVAVDPVVQPSGDPAGEERDGSDDPNDPDGAPRRSLAQKMRAWLGGAV